MTLEVEVTYMAPRERLARLFGRKMTTYERHALSTLRRSRDLDPKLEVRVFELVYAGETAVQLTSEFR